MQKVAIYPGSFDPPTVGHFDIIERASDLFKELIVAVGVNHAKKSFFTLEEKLFSLRKMVEPFCNVSVDSFECLLVDYAKERCAQVIVRGLRAVADFDYEFQMTMANQKLAPEIETVFLITKWENGYLSSSVVREVAQRGGDFRSFVPEVVANLMENKDKPSLFL